MKTPLEMTLDSLDNQLEKKIVRADSAWETYKEESDKLHVMRRLFSDPARIREQEKRVARWFDRASDWDEEIAWLEADIEAQAGPYGIII